MELEIQNESTNSSPPQDFKCKAAVVKVSGGEEGDVGTSEDKEGSSDFFWQIFSFIPNNYPRNGIRT